MEDVGIETSVLYTTLGLAFGKIVSRDWAIDVARAYNDWLYNTYMKRSPRFRGMGLVPLQEPEAAVEELKRAVKELGMCGAMLPSTGIQANWATSATGRFIKRQTNWAARSASTAAPTRTWASMM